MILTNTSVLTSSDKVSIFVAVLGAVLAYLFGRYQHKTEYKENLKNDIFGKLLTVELPEIYSHFYKNYNSANAYNALSSKLKSLKNKFSILIISYPAKYEKIKKIIAEIDDLITFNSYHLIDGVKTPQPITEINQINIRKKEINKKMIELYSVIGINKYKNVLYSGWIKQKIYYCYLYILNRKK